MKYWINAVGYGVPNSIRLSKTYIYSGHPVLARWYGRYKLNNPTLYKMGLILRNGEHAEH